MDQIELNYENNLEINFRFGKKVASGLSCWRIFNVKTKNNIKIIMPKEFNKDFKKV